MKRRSNRSRFQRRKARETDSFIKNLFKPQIIILGLVVSYFIVSLVTITSFAFQNPFVEAPRWYFGVAMTRPLILLVAAMCVLIERSWTYVAAVVLVGIIIYSTIIRAFVGISYAHGTPIFTVDAVQIWFHVTSSTQLINTALAAVIAAIGITQLFRRFSGWLHAATTTRGESPTIS